MQASQPKPLPPVKITLKAATGVACARFGEGTEPPTGGERDLLNGIPALNQRFEDVMRRLVAAGRGEIENPESENNAVAVLNSWNNEIDNRINSTFGQIAQLDFRNTKPSDELLKGELAGVNFAGATQNSIRRATAYKSCLQAIEANLKARVKP